MLFARVMEFYGGEIEHMPFIRRIIDYKFSESRNIMGRSAYSYVTFIVAPFITQMLIKDYNTAKWFSHLFMLGNLLYAFSRCLMIKVRGFNYLFENWQI